MCIIPSPYCCKSFCLTSLWKFMKVRCCNTETCANTVPGFLSEQAIVLALNVVKHDDWFKSTEIWLYRGAWQEFEPHEIQMAVVMSPEQLSHKIEAIFRHQSQKDRAMFPGADSREFWQRARDRNRVHKPPPLLHCSCLSHLMQFPYSPQSD